MVRICLLIAVCVLVLGRASAMGASCPSQVKDENALLQLEHSWAKALEERDISAVGCILADEFEDADVDGQVHDRADALSRVAHRRPSRNELNALRAHVYGDLGFVRGLNKVIGSDGKLLAQVRFTDIFIYRDGRWQAMAGQETLVSSPAK